MLLMVEWICLVGVQTIKFMVYVEEVRRAFGVYFTFVVPSFSDTYLGRTQEMRQQLGSFTKLQLLD